MAERSPFVQNLLEQVDLMGLVSEFCPLEQQSSGLWVGWHKVHESESKTSLVVYANRVLQDWVCWGCIHNGHTSFAGGTAIDFILSMGIVQTPGEAIAWLCDKYGIKRLDWTPEQQAKWERRRNERQIVEAVLMESADYYHRRLPPEQREYFHRRGLTDETIDKFKLGYADGTLYDAFTKGELLDPDGTHKHNDRGLLLSGLFVRFDDGTTKDAFEHRSLIPYWLRGRVVYMIGRCDTDDPEEIKKLPKWNQQKYKKLSTYDSKQRPYISQEVQNDTFYGEDSVHEHEEGVITEGVIDCLLALQSEFSCISPVTIGFREADYPKLAKLTNQWESVYIINDNEESGSGERGALATAQYLFEQGRDVRLVELPRPKDVKKVDLADFLNASEEQKKERIGELRKLMDDAPDFVEWKIHEALELHERKRPKAVNEIAKLFAYNDTSTQERYIDRVVSTGLAKRSTIKRIIKEAKIEKAKVAKAERIKEAEEVLPIEAFLKMQIEEIRGNRFRKSFQIKRSVSNFVISDMQEIGKFYQTVNREFYWFNNEAKELHQIGDDWLGVFINDRYGINQSETEYEFLTSDLITVAATRGQKTTVNRFAFYEKEDSTLYIFNNANQIYRLDGELVELVDNGADGVLFLSNSLDESFTYKPNVQDKIWQIVVNPISFAQGGEVNLNPDEQRKIFTIWIYSLFFESIIPTKPLQFFLGEKGSGKTTRQRIIGKWLFGKNFDVVPINKEKEDSFVAAITNNYFVAFDNVDAQIAWLPDRLAQAATGQAIKLRELYTTNTERTYFPKCFVSLNAREPKFKRDDVVDRLLLFRVDRLPAGKFRPEREILEEIEVNRNALWSELIDDLNGIVATLKTDKSKFSSNLRMADWASFGWKVSKIGGQENADAFAQLLSKMDKAQSEFLMEDNTIFEYLNEWLEDSTNAGREVKVADLFTDFQKIAESRKSPLPFKTPRSLGMQMRPIISNLKKYFEIEERQYNRAWHYTFTPKTQVEGYETL